MPIGIVSNQPVNLFTHYIGNPHISWRITLYDNLQPILLISNL